MYQLDGIQSTFGVLCDCCISQVYSLIFEPTTRLFWSESLLIACSFYSPQAILRRINEVPCHRRWMYRLIWAFAGHTGLIVGFVVRRLITLFCELLSNTVFYFFYCKAPVNSINKLYWLNLSIRNNLSQRMIKPSKWYVRPAKTRNSLGIRPVWSESSLCAQWVAKDPSFLHAVSEDSDQTGRMPLLIWVFAWRTCHFAGFIMRWLISNHWRNFAPLVPFALICTLWTWCPESDYLLDTKRGKTES